MQQPLRQESETAGTPPQAARARRAASPQPRRIMLVDDEELLLRSWQRILARRGIEADLFTSAEEARDHLAAASAPYDVVVTDMRMPGAFDGHALARWLLHERPDAARHVVVMSGASVPLDVDDEERLTVLVKPFDIGTLVAVLLADHPA